MHALVAAFTAHVERLHACVSHHLPSICVARCVGCMHPRLCVSLSMLYALPGGQLAPECLQYCMHVHLAPLCLLARVRLCFGQLTSMVNCPSPMRM